MLNILDDKEVIVFVGNFNVGKLVIFNKLIGRYVEVLNYFGIIVDVNYGFYKDYVIVDILGVYGIFFFNDEEIVMCDIVLSI